MNGRSDRGHEQTLLERNGRLDTSEAVNELAGELSDRMWPASTEVQLTTMLPDLEYPECDFHRIMEILLTRALGASPRPDEAVAVVGCRSDTHFTMFSVHSSGVGAFAGNNGGSCLVSEVKALVEANGGRFWVDRAFGPGSTAFFTIPTRKNGHQILSHDTRW
ncbi:MAG: hypothetical protein KKF41_05865 [Actinobacteria bacterium]|nr:hypothetical protein [Actinomycetota bacterium]MBU1944842.1 hypothetical protein [Actinomycetota bacterium]MBU2687091.1 hypothetical protein [Actinomycetota bacterium]